MSKKPKLNYTENHTQSNFGVKLQGSGTKTSNTLKHP